MSKYTPDEFYDTLVYEKNTKTKDINIDITAKWIILNSLGEKTQSIIKGDGKTAYEIWNVLKNSFTKNTGTLKIELKKRLEKFKYNTDTDINIFITNLQNTIDELERVDSDLSTDTKIGILNRSVPDNLRWLNVFQYKKNWEKCKDYVKNIIPDIIFSNFKESTYSKSNNNIFLAVNQNKNQREETIKIILK